LSRLAPRISPKRWNYLNTREANGADGLLIVPPFYYKHPSLDGLTRYFSILFEQVKIPINLYHIPFATGVPISHELLHAMEKYPNLTGIKIP